MDLAGCVSLLLMRRVKAILVIVALLSMPLAVLAQSASEDMPSCGGMCCLPHHGAHHPGPQHATTQVTAPAPTQNHEKSSAACEHGSSAPLNCAFNCGNTHAVHFFVSPLAPTKPSNLASVESLEPPAAAKFHLESAHVLPGFLATPFQPPRA
jgi:hypothetical protein